MVHTGGHTWASECFRLGNIRRRIPAKLKKFGLTGEIKKSLHPSDCDEAVLRCQEENLRLERMSQENLFGRTVSKLSQLQITALADEFYREMVDTHRENPGQPADWEQALQAHEKKKTPPIGLQPLGTHYRFVFGDEADAFLRKRNLHLVGEHFEAFVRAFAAAKEQAARQLLKNAGGDYRPDPGAERFPALRLSDEKQLFKNLWPEYCAAKVAAASTKKKWEPYFKTLIKRIGTDDMSKVTEGLLEWRHALMASKLSKVTVRDGYVAAMKAFFGWAKRMKKLSVDPSMNVHVEVSGKHGNYSVARQRNPNRINPTYASVGNKLAEWVRNLGIKDELVKPNHGWRHRFKTIGRKSKMDWLILDGIQGHAPRTEGEEYGEVPPDVMYPEILKHPRDNVVAAGSQQRLCDVYGFAERHQLGWGTDCLSPDLKGLQVSQ